jgi:hypothetical protein
LKPAIGNVALTLHRLQQRSAALKVDWAKVTTSLGLKGQTVASLQAFKKRNDDARRKLQQLSELPTTVDFSAYRSTLKNQAVVNEIERRFKDFKPSTYDVSRQLKAIEAFEVEAVKNAEVTKEKVDMQLSDLEKTLKNIEEARPFEDLTVVGSGTEPHYLRETLSSHSSRTRLRQPSPRSIRRRQNSLPRDAGMCQATRSVSFSMAR